MANDNNTNEKVFDVPKKDATELVNKSEKSLQRWVRDGLIDVEYKDGPYGREAYYCYDDLLRMRDGKPRQPDKGGDGPLAQADMALIASESKWTNEQLSQAMTTLSEELPAFRREIQEAKDQTIEEVRKQGDLQNQIGQLQQTESQLKSEHEELEGKIEEIKNKYEEVSKYKEYFRMALLWGTVAVLLVIFLSLIFAPQLEGIRNLIINAFN